MVLHVFGLRWKREASAADKQRALAEIHAFPQQIPGILQLHAGPNLSENAQGYETVGALHFQDRQTLKAYLQHPAHQAFVTWVGPLIEAVDLDLALDATDPSAN